MIPCEDINGSSSSNQLLRILAKTLKASERLLKSRWKFKLTVYVLLVVVARAKMTGGFENA